MNWAHSFRDSGLNHCQHSAKLQLTCLHSILLEAYLQVSCSENQFKRPASRGSKIRPDSAYSSGSQTARHLSEQHSLDLSAGGSGAQTARKRGMNQTLPPSWRPEPLNLTKPRLRTMEVLQTPRVNYCSSASDISLPDINQKRNSKTLSIGKSRGKGSVSRGIRGKVSSAPSSLAPSVLDMMKEAAPKTPQYLIGSTKYPKAYIEGELFEAHTIL